MIDGPRGRMRFATRPLRSARRGPVRSMDLLLIPPRGGPLPAIVYPESIRTEVPGCSPQPLHRPPLPRPLKKSRKRSSTSARCTTCPSRTAFGLLPTARSTRWPFGLWPSLTPVLDIDLCPFSSLTSLSTGAGPCSSTDLAAVPFGGAVSLTDVLVIARRDGQTPAFPLHFCPNCVLHQPLRIQNQCHDIRCPESSRRKPPERAGRAAPGSGSPSGNPRAP
jgi:hypothetical protein